MKNQLQTLLFLFIAFSCTRQSQNTIEIPSKIQFYAVKEEGTINVFNEGQQLAVVTQQANQIIDLSFIPYWRLILKPN